MELAELQSYIKDGFSVLREKVLSTKKNTADLTLFMKQYDPKDHDIMDTSKRPSKIVTTDTGTSAIEPTRLPVPLQKKIVTLATSFLCGNPIELVATPTTDLENGMLQVVKRTWNNNKLDYDSKELAKMMMSETEVAEIWYRTDADAIYWAGTVNEKRPHRLRMKIVANSLGDQLYPVFDNSGDMIAFGRGFQLKVNDKTEDHFDIYTADTTYKGTLTNGTWIFVEEKTFFGKIPVIYYSQPKPEWADVQWLIDRFEKVISNHGDTNDYFASPIVFIEGDIEGFAKKGENGKVLQGKDGAKASYLTWDQSPESLKLEYNNLRSLLYDMTDTPDISIETMKGLGTFSGIALKMLFLAPHLKAADKESTFGKSIQRRINLIKAVMVTFNSSLAPAGGLNITPKFTYYLPKDEAGIVDTLITATGNKPVMSQETAVKQNPLVSDPQNEMELIKNDENAAGILPVF
jgi:SPP1 family phage portal protein